MMATAACLLLPMASTAFSLAALRPATAPRIPNIAPPLVAVPRIAMCITPEVPNSAVGITGGDVWSGVRVNTTELESVVEEAAAADVLSEDAAATKMQAIQRGKNARKK